jgi:hypothetical protein
VSSKKSKFAKFSVREPSNNQGKAKQEELTDKFLIDTRRRLVANFGLTKLVVFTVPATSSYE